MTIPEEQGPSGSAHLQLQEIPWGPHVPLPQTCQGERDREEEDGPEAWPRHAPQNQKDCFRIGPPTQLQRGHLFWGWGEQAALLQQHHGVQSGMRPAMHGYQLDVTPLLPSPGLHTTPLHITSVFRSTEELDTVYFLLTGRVSVEEMLLETVCPGEEHPRRQAA